MKTEPPLEYARPPKKQPLGCLGALMALSTILQFLATAVFTLDLLDGNWYMAAALILMLAAPFWLAGVTCILVTLFRAPGQFQQFLPLSILAHLSSPILFLAVLFRYNH